MESLPEDDEGGTSKPLPTNALPGTSDELADEDPRARFRGPKVFLVRHAHDEGPKDPYRGRHLSSLGRRQADALARRMADWQLDAIVCSDTFRSKETAAPVHAFHPHIPLIVDVTFREVSTGKLAAFERGDPAQSGLMERLESAWQKVVTLPHTAVAFIIHNGMIKYLLGRALKYEREPRPPFHSSLTGISALQVKPRGRADVRFFNDMRHLTPELVVDEKAWVEDIVTGRWRFGAEDELPR